MATKRSQVHSFDGAKWSHWLNGQMLRRDWKAADLARALDVPNGSVSRWVTGQRQPSPASAERIADVFGAEPDFVLTLAGHRPATEPFDADDPRNELIGMIKRIEDWPPLSYEAIHDQLTKILHWQKKQRKAKR